MPVEVCGAVRVLLLEEAGPPIATEDDVLDLLGDVLSAEARWLGVPSDRLDAAFFDLGTRLAGAIVQKLQNYGVGLAVVGDVERHVRASGSFRDLVVEADRGRGGLLFVRDVAALRERLGGAAQP